MSKFVQVEVCVDGTLTRASARVLNRAFDAAGSKLRFSGSDAASLALTCADAHGLTVRVVPAASLSGADKGRHTREVNRARSAQARRVERKAAETTVAPRRPMPFPRVAA